MARNRGSGNRALPVAVTLLVVIVLVFGISSWRSHEAAKLAQKSTRNSTSLVPLTQTWIATKIPSPNFSYRLPGYQIDTIVLHATGTKTLAGTVGCFRDPNSHVSAHFVVGRNGTVVQMVALENCAWHAGNSWIDGHAHVNEDSIGIEMVNEDTGHQPYPDAQYQAVASLVYDLQSRYSIRDDHVVSHAQIARPVGRKSDPEGFNFARLFTKIAIIGVRDQRKQKAPTPALAGGDKLKTAPADSKQAST